MSGTGSEIPLGPIGGRRKLAPVHKDALNSNNADDAAEAGTHAPSAGGSLHPMRQRALEPVSRASGSEPSKRSLPPIEGGGRGSANSSRQGSPAGSDASHGSGRRGGIPPSSTPGRDDGAASSSTPPANNEGSRRGLPSYGSRERLVESSPRPGSSGEAPPPKLRRYQRSKGGQSSKPPPAPTTTGTSPRTSSPRGEFARKRGRTSSQTGHGEEYVDETATVGTLASMHKGAPSRPRAEVFYVENLATGEFMKVNRAQLAQVTMEDKSDNKVISRNTTFKSILDHTGRIIMTVLLMAQGLLGGFALLQFYMSYPRFSPHTKFLAYYSPISADSQRIYLILTTLSLLGGIDKYAKDRLEGWRNGGWRQQVRDAIIIFCYLCAFVFSLANAQMDDLLAYANNRVPQWWDTIGIEPKFGRQLDMWHAFNIIRVASSFFAWLLVCYESKTYNFNSSNWELFRNSRARSGAVQPGTSGVAGLTSTANQQSQA